MDLNDAARQIFARHWVLIVVLTLVGTAVPVVLDRYQEPEYVATARVTFGEDPRDSQEAKALADTVGALATSSEVMAGALDAAGVPRTQGAVEDRVEVKPVGSSGVLAVSVTDRDPQVAATLANALAGRVVQVRGEDLVGDRQQTIDELTAQIDELNAQITDLETRPFVPDLTAAPLSLQHEDLLAQRTSLQRQRHEIDQALAAIQLPEVVDSSQTSGKAVDSALPARLAVGGLLGLILGIGLAAAGAALRPTLGRTALSRRLRGPLLGRLTEAPGADPPAEDPWLVRYITIAAQRAGVQSVQLVPVGRPPADVSGLARWLDGRDGVQVRPLVLPGPGSHGTSPAATGQVDRDGIVVVAPEVTRVADLAPLERHLQLTRRPVLGVITYRGKPAESPDVESVDAEYRTSAVERDTAPTRTPAS
ncbi:hypothetical protein [Modestobacter sp. I12A-02662]|uniref:hypothetical protein n=1 Tax=Modestobacter sp. I12A-02662 TaxID=1730496 RepID=UPI0034DF02F0